MLIIGLGNRLRGDDAAGLAVIDRLEAYGCPAQLARSDGDPASLIPLWEGQDRVVLIDAMHSGVSPGHWRRLEGDQIDALRGRRLSSHTLDLPQSLALARALDRQAAELTMIGIEAAADTHGAALTPAVAEAVVAVASALQSWARS